MSEAKIPWYSMNSNLALEEHDPVDFTQAVKIAEGYLARGGLKFKTGEEAIAATTFGFSRSSAEFIEICVHGVAHISFKFEAPDTSTPWFLKPWKGVFQHQEELGSRETLVQRIEAFYTHSTDELVRRYKS